VVLGHHRRRRMALAQRYTANREIILGRLQREPQLPLRSMSVIGMFRQARAFDEERFVLPCWLISTWRIEIFWISSSLSRPLP
jgi:hypothetical protein